MGNSTFSGPVRSLNGFIDLEGGTEKQAVTQDSNGDLYGFNGDPVVIGGGPSGLLVNNTATGTVTIDLSLYSAAQLTVTGNTTIAFSNLPAVNEQVKFTLTVIDGSAFTFTHPVGTRWGGSGVVGSAPSLQASGADKIVYDIYNNGAVVYDGAYIGRYA